MKREQEDKLKRAFQAIKWEAPSADFESKLMNRIVKVERETNQKRQFIYWGSLVTICTLLVVLSVVTLILTGVDLEKLTDTLLSRILSIDSLYISIGGSLLLLLLANFILRVKLHQRQP